MSLTSAQIFQLLGERRFPKPEFLWIGQVANSTGFRAHRFIDGVALSLWPSRGIHLHTVEIKVDRRDWMKEKATPEKAEQLAKFAHFMWLAIDGTAKRPVLNEDEEVPTNWGILEVTTRGKQTIVKTRRKATLLEPIAPTWGFVATVMRNADRADEIRIDQIVSDQITKRKDTSDNSLQGVYEHLREKYSELSSKVTEFQRVSGVTIEWGDIGRIGQAVRQLMDPTTGAAATNHLRDALKSIERERVLIQYALDQVQVLSGKAEQP